MATSEAVIRALELCAETIGRLPGRQSGHSCLVGQDGALAGLRDLIDEQQDNAQAIEDAIADGGDPAELATMDAAERERELRDEVA